MSRLWHAAVEADVFDFTVIYLMNLLQSTVRLFVFYSLKAITSPSNPFIDSEMWFLRRVGKNTISSEKLCKNLHMMQRGIIISVSSSKLISDSACFQIGFYCSTRCL